MHDKIRFSIEFRTKYNPIVTAAATTKLNTAHENWKKDDKRLEIEHVIWAT